MNKTLKLITSRAFIFIVAVIIQITIIIWSILLIDQYSRYASIVFQIISLGAVLYVVNANQNPSYKLAWVILILLFPILGGVFYLLFGNNKAAKYFEKAIESGFFDNNSEARIDYEAQELIGNLSPSAKRQSDYLSRVTRYYPRQNTEVTYFSVGEEKMEALLEQLKTAKNFIFLEYFIISEGYFWSNVLEILQKKASEGLDVRIIYDDAGCINTLPKNYHKKLKDMGIKVVVFNPLKLKLNVQFNNRDHRKIAIIDGSIGFTGGINLADEYINHIERFGHWKDTAIMLKGEGVINLTEMFLQIWCFHTGEPMDLYKFVPNESDLAKFHGKGFVQSFCDSPLDNEPVGETVYLNIINDSRKYVYINTPYLIIDNELQTALINAAKSGVEVILTLPYIPDKWYAHIIAKTYYHPLLRSGVKIFEYTPGFNHAKSFVCDDEIAVVGTINLDYRSLYLNFECATWMYKTNAIHDIKEDYLKTLRISKEITFKNMESLSGMQKLIQSIIKVFSPIM
ncbi:MAG: cardiolipin synthase [Filifactoraceae bacterium]